MTYSEAIETIKIAQAEVEWEYPMAIAAALDMAIQAMELQVAKKLKNIEKIFPFEFGNCPSCGERLLNNGMMNRCPGCTQVLDWSEE